MGLETNIGLRVFMAQQVILGATYPEVQMHWRFFLRCSNRMKETQIAQLQILRLGVKRARFFL
jgi:hypothetical protein